MTQQILGRGGRRLYSVAAVALAVCAGCQSSRPVKPTASALTQVAAGDASAGENQAISQVTFDETPELGGQVADESAGAMSVDGMITAEEGNPSVEEAPNTVEAFETIAVSNHPAIIEARAQVDAARGRYTQAGLPFNPVFQYQSEEVGNEGFSGLHSLRLSQQFVTANKLGLAQQVAAQTVGRRRAELRRAELEVLTRVRIAFARTLIAQQRADLTDKIVKLSEQSVKTAALLLEAKEVSRIALLQTRVEAERAQIAAENAATLLLVNRRALAAAMGVDELSAAPLQGDPAGGLDEAPWQSLIEDITTNSPELLAAGTNIQRARWALQLACAQVTPNVTGQLGVGVDGATDDAFAVVGVSVPLPIRNRNQGNIRSARAEMTSALAASERTQLDLESRLADAVGRYLPALQRYRRLTEQVLPDAEETFELSRVAFEAGESSYLEFLVAQRTLVTTRLRILDALQQAREASAEINGYLVTLR